MGASSSLDLLVKGHVFPPATFAVSAGELAAYLSAIGDEAVRTLGSDSVPPVAAAAFALRELLAVFELPLGSVHTSEEIEFDRPLRLGETVRCESKVVQASDRQGHRFSVLEQRVVDAEGRARLIVHSSLMSPLGSGRS